MLASRKRKERVRNGRYGGRYGHRKWEFADPSRAQAASVRMESAEFGTSPTDPLRGHAAVATNALFYVVRED